MTTTYLGFLMNRSDKEEFVAPVVANELTEAKRELQKAYPDSRYALLTVYTRSELENVLKGVDRWPGLPSKVQAPLAEKTAPVRVSTGGLPPLPGQVQATVQAVENIQPSALPGWMQSLADTQAPKKTANPTLNQTSFMMRPAVPAPKSQPQTITQMMAEQRPAPAPQSLIERLKMAKGETVASQPIQRQPQPQMPAATISRSAQGASVIDILKGMRK